MYEAARQLGGRARRVDYKGVALDNGLHILIGAYAQTLRLMERSAPGVLHTDLLACHAYAGGLAAAAKVRCPSLVVAAARDVMAPPRAVEPLERALNGQVARLDGIGHALMSEAPDDVLDALRRFLAMPLSPAPIAAR